MELIDWRELYAANRAVIEGREPMPAAGSLRPPTLETGTVGRPRSGGRLTRPGSGLTRAGGGLIALEHDDGARTRPVFVHAPPGVDPAVPAPLVVMLHGCTQTAASFATGSLMNDTADHPGFLVAYPEQSRDDNPSCCWNWFSTSHQARGGGEPAYVAGAVRTVAAATDRWGGDPARGVVAGMSAGGAQAAGVGGTHPGPFAGGGGPHRPPPP